MKGAPIFIGDSSVKLNDEKIEGEYLILDDELFYKISHFNPMPPFFMSIISNSDHWMFIWSNGALTAGRKNPDHALFPYYTDDKIKNDSDKTGSKTIVFIENSNKSYLWEPFSSNYYGIYDIQRNIYKNKSGNKIVFEEINNDLEISFQYAG